MAIISKRIFIQSVEAVREQLTYDMDQHYSLSCALKLEDSVLPLYDNSLVIKALIALLQLHFPKDAEGFCEIEHYCYDLNFGNVSEDVFVSTEDLWIKMTTKGPKFILSTHPLIDDNTGFFKTMETDE